MKDASKALPLWCEELMRMVERVKAENENKLYKTQHHPYAQSR